MLFGPPLSFAKWGSRWIYLCFTIIDSLRDRSGSLCSLLVGLNRYRPRYSSICRKVSFPARRSQKSQSRLTRGFHPGIHIFHAGSCATWAGVRQNTPGAIIGDQTPPAVGSGRSKIIEGLILEDGDMGVAVNQGHIRPGFQHRHHAFEGVLLVAVIGAGQGDIFPRAAFMQRLMAEWEDSRCSVRR